MNAALTAAHLVEGLCELGPSGPRLMASRCELCDEQAFPRRSVCPRCKRPSMRPVHLGEHGTLFSFTVCHVAPSGWRAPYLQAYVELPEGLRVFTLVSDAVEPRIDALEAGMAMELVIEPVAPGDERVTYKYRPLEEHA